MRTHLSTVRYVIRATLLVMLGALADVTAAGSPDESQVVDGLAIYLGILPAEMLEGHPEGHPEAEMHGGIPAGKHRHHVMVALFDSRTGQRITGAEVKARVSEVGLYGPEKTLEPMVINGLVTYGNYFSLPGYGPYRIALRIRRPGIPDVIEAEFEYSRGRA